MEAIKRLFIIAPEPSGDHLAAEFISAVRELNPNIEIKGMGGKQMASLGVETLVSTEGLAILGLIEALGAWRNAVNKAREVAKHVHEFKPDAVVLIDSWGFTLRAAQQIRKLLPNVRLIKMVGPQVWATRAGRAKTLAQTYDELWCIHEFEEPYYAGLPIKVRTIGNPGLGRLEKGSRERFITKFALTSHETIGILPGSRKREIENILPPMLEGARLLSQRHNGLVFVTVAASAIKDKLLEYEKDCGFKWLIVDESEKSDAFASMKAAMACSGTITSELGEAKVPIIIGYLIDKLTYFIVRTFLLKTPFICLMNVAMGREIVRELLQDELNGENIASEISLLIEDESYRLKQIENQNQALKLMGLDDAQNDENTSARRAARYLMQK